MHTLALAHPPILVALRTLDVWARSGPGATLTAPVSACLALAVAVLGRDRQPSPSTVVIGAGPAGLTAAYLLTRQGRPVTVVEQERQVGGLSRTIEHAGYRFDIGGHRFFTKVRAVSDLWRAMLGGDLLRRPRLSRIYFRGRFFQYPLRPLNALAGLGVWRSVAVVLSYGWSQLRPIRPERSFEDWVSNRFGRRLYRIFFKTYTEKVWGLPCERISAAWAAQRIKGLSLGTAILAALGRGRGSAGIKTLIDEFEYPRFGPGMMWDRFRDHVVEGGGVLALEATVSTVAHADGRVTRVGVRRGGATEWLPAEAVLSTMPLRDLIRALDPPAPPDVAAAAERLKYRDFLTVAIVVDAPDLFPDNWVYVHDPSVRVGRIQNFKNWSPDMVPDPAKTCLGLEYFCFEGDDLWSMSDEALVEVGRREVATLGLVDPARVAGGFVVRVPKAYPVYDDGYEEALDVVRRYLDGLGNLQVAGRNGMHKYNNQDHSMVTAMLAVRNLLGAREDVWAVNADDEYHEAVDAPEDTITARELRDLASSQPPVPTAAPMTDGG